MMKFKYESLLCIVFLIALLFPSCVQSNTHQNIRTAGQYYEGFKLDQPKNIYLSKGRWYIKAEKFNVKKHYNTLSFSKSNSYQLKTSGASLGTVYLSISKDTAKNLRNKDAVEIFWNPIYHTNTKSSGNKENLTELKKYPVLARLNGNENSIHVYDENKEQEQNIAYQSLSYLNFLLVDTPAIIISNTAICVPFIIVIPVAIVLSPILIYESIAT